MTFLLNSPTVRTTSRFSTIPSERSLEAFAFPLNSLPILPAGSDRTAQAELIDAHWITWGAVFPLVLWAGQEEVKGDSGGTLVFMVCCAIVIAIFSKTGWRNEEPK